MESSHSYGRQQHQAVWLKNICTSAGYLVSVDSYMNLQLASTEEYIDGQFTGNLGEVLIR